ncbi:MAG: 50S ribosomal protein L24e, partial [Thermoplasmata archaeon]
MVVKRQCSFCAAEIEPGTGAMFVKRDGTVFHFCSGSCRKQQLHLGRVGHRFKWTRAHALKKAADRSSAAARAQAPASPVRKGAGRT